MMKKGVRTVTVLVFLLLLFVGSAQGELIDRGNGMIYDTVLDVTWLQDANYAMTSEYDEDGRMSWYEAVEWTDQLVYGGYDDWRLPTTIDGQYEIGYDGSTTAGYNITTSEMGYMYYVNLGNLGYYDLSGNYQSEGGLKNTSPFINIQSWDYLSGTTHNYNPNSMWLFHFQYGDQYIGAKDTIDYYVWAVRDGDVASVSILGSIVLLGSGIFGLGVLRRNYIHHFV